MKSRGPGLVSNFYKLWIGAIGVVMAAFLLAAFLLPRSFGLTAFSDIVQALFLLSGAASFVPLAVRSHARLRLFWILISAGIGLWLCYQLFWTYTEIVLHQDVPDLWAWDIVLFAHLVPLMAAIALRPHVPRDEYAARVGQLDFAVLLVWWLYLYVLVVMSWQYVVPDIAAYNRNLNSVYNAEKLAFLAGLVACIVISKGQWRKFYSALFAATLCYSAGSTVANLALASRVYYSGSLYDVPLVAGMGSLTWIGLRTKIDRPEPDTPLASTAYGVWIARCGMIAVFSLPLFAAWAISDSEIPPQIRVFRVALTFLAALALGIMIFIRQQLLDRELVNLLNHSRESFDNLKRLQAQLLQSEKLASIGQLVGGAAHELNNPITAMLGYSDLLLNTDLSADQRPLAAKIGQYVRRTKSLVASLISFARQAPAPKTLLDVNTLARTAVKLTQPQWESLEIEVHTQLDPALPKVLGDSNQLLQVCLQLLGNCLHLLAEQGGRTMTISTGRRAGICVLQIATEPLRDAEPSSTDEDGLALSACQGILQEHRGQISREARPDGAVLLQVEVPAADPVPSKPKEATVPVMWQSRPYA
jgi:signal transduction histidine kinase